MITAQDIEFRFIIHIQDPKTLSCVTGIEKTRPWYHHYPASAIAVFSLLPSAGIFGAVSCLGAKEGEGGSGTLWILLSCELMVEDREELA